MRLFYFLFSYLRCCREPKALVGEAFRARLVGVRASILAFRAVSVEFFAQWNQAMTIAEFLESRSIFDLSKISNPKYYENHRAARPAG